MKILVIGKEGRLRHYTRDLSRFERFEVCYVPMGAPDCELLRIGADASVILADAMGRVSGDVIRQMPHLRMIHSEGVGYQGIDLTAASERGIFVCNCQGMNASAVAEQAILLMLAQLRGLCTGDRAVREGRQITVKENHMLQGTLRELSDCTIGLIGFGDIAKQTAKLAAAFGAKVIYTKPHRAASTVEEKYGVTYLPQGELLAVSDIVSLHLPVTPQTKNLCSTAFFAAMKPGAILINTARGELVDSAALIEALRCGQLSGAGLDTIAGEPVAADNVLLTADPEIEDRLTLSCHVGGITASSFARGAEMFWRNVDKIAVGEPPERIVNR